MTKILSNLFILFLLLFINQWTFSDDVSADWQCYKRIKIKGDNKYKSIFLDKEVYQYAKQNLSDIRIVDVNEKFIPFYINNAFKVEEKEDKKYNTTLISIHKSKKKDDDSSFFDFQILPTDKKDDEKIVSKKLILFIDNKNYSKQIEVYGRTDTSDWKYIKKDTIYNINNFTKNEIIFKKSYYYNFYRIKVIDNKEKVIVRKCILYFNSLQEKNQQYRRGINLEYKINNKEKHSIITIKNPYHLKIIKVSLSIDGNFNRKYQFYENTSDYHIATGKICNLKFNDIDISETSINFEAFPISDAEYFIKIINDDDEPLKIKQITVDYIIDKIVFEYNGTESYRLYFGNPSAKNPSYDIETYSVYIEKENQDFQVSPL